MIRKILSLRRTKNGQAFVEFALAIPIFLIVVIGIFEFARLMAFTASVYTAAREGARYGSASSTYTDCTGIADAANRVGVLASPITVNIGYDIDSDTDVAGTFPAACQCETLNMNICAAADPDAVPRTVVKASAPFRFVFLPLPEFTVRSQAVRTIIHEVDYDEPAGGATSVPTVPDPLPDVTETPTATPLPSPTYTIEPSSTPEGGTPIPPTPIPYCSFLSAGPAEWNTITTSPRNFSFEIYNASAIVDAKITRITATWTELPASRRITLTEIRYREFKINPYVYDAPYTWGSTAGPIVSANNIAAPPIPAIEFYYSLKRDKDIVQNIGVTLRLQYTDPGTSEVVNCELYPDETAFRVY